MGGVYLFVVGGFYTCMSIGGCDQWGLSVLKRLLKERSICLWCEVSICLRDCAGGGLSIEGRFTSIPSLEKTTEWMLPLCPSSTVTLSTPSGLFSVHNRTVKSQDPVA